MNKLSKIAGQYWVLLCLFYLIPTISSGNVVSEKDIENRVLNLQTSVDARYTDEVQKRISLYTDNYKEASSVILGRVSIYFPLFENVLREKGLPQDLKYLAVVESGLNPHATSKAGAAGLWQFMKPTGRMHGLKINGVIDERRDPVKSTHAAVEYLEYLHGRFGDWTLAIAAYNCGPGNVSKAIKRSGGKQSYWEIQKYLPRETRNYIPKFIAYSYIMNYYYDHDLTPTMPDNHLIYTASAKVYDKLSLKSISNKIDVDYAIIKLLNPAYIKGYIPSNDGRYILTLPEKHMYDYAYEHNLELFYHANPINTTSIAEAKVEEAQEEVLPQREVFANVSELQNINDVLITMNNLHEEDINDIHHLRMKYFKPYRLYKIKRNESLKDIAVQSSVSLDELMELNGITRENPPKLGDVIKIMVK